MVVMARILVVATDPKLQRFRSYWTSLAVIAGLDPAIHLFRKEPALGLLPRGMDTRVKPAHDDLNSLPRNLLPFRSRFPAFVNHRPVACRPRSGALWIC